MIVEPDEVKTKAQPSTGRKEIWTYTAVVLVAGLRYALADATPEGLWLQVAALLLELDVLSGGRRLLVLGDGASWIRSWFESLGIDPKAMIVCWWHLQKRCYENLSAAGGPKDRRRSLQEALLDRLWAGEVDAAITLLREAMEWVRNPKALCGPDRLPGETPGVHPRLRGTATGGAVDREHAGGEVQRLGGVGALQAPGDELVGGGGAGAGGTGSGASERRARRLASGGRHCRNANCPGHHAGRVETAGAPTGLRNPPAPPRSGRTFRRCLSNERRIDETAVGHPDPGKEVRPRCECHGNSDGSPESTCSFTRRSCSFSSSPAICPSCSCSHSSGASSCMSWAMP